MPESAKKEAPDILTTLGEILVDIQRLFRQEVALLRVEVREEAEKRKPLVSSILRAMLCTSLAALFIGSAVSLLVASLLKVELWVGFLATAAIFAVLARVWSQRAKNLMASGKPKERASLKATDFSVYSMQEKG